MDDVAWFRSQLQANLDGFVWAVQQRPPERLFLAPPRHPEAWSTARLVYHLVSYERKIGLPSMRQWLGGLLPDSLGMEEDAAAEEWAWQHEQEIDVASMLADLTIIRAEQIALLPRFSATHWDERRDAIWGAVTLRWVNTKSYQHTVEHTDEVLRMLLWWDK